MSAHITLGEMMYALLTTQEVQDDTPSELDVDDLNDTPTLKTALDSPEKGKWIDAIEKELQSIRNEDIYDLVDLSKEQVDNLLGNKLVLCRKRGPTGQIERYKVHLTACGDHQCESINYEETFAPVVKSTSLRVFFALAAQLALQVCHLDVTAAFLNGTLKETVFMRQP